MKFFSKGKVSKEYQFISLEFYFSPFLLIVSGKNMHCIDVACKGHCITVLQSKIVL